jgi:hypothetical protein
MNWSCIGDFSKSFKFGLAWEILFFYFLWFENYFLKYGATLKKYCLWRPHLKKCLSYSYFEKCFSKQFFKKKKNIKETKQNKKGNKNIEPNENWPPRAVATWW